MLVRSKGKLGLVVCGGSNKQKKEVQDGTLETILNALRKQRGKGGGRSLKLTGFGQIMEGRVFVKRKKHNETTI